MSSLRRALKDGHREGLNPLPNSLLPDEVLPGHGQVPQHPIGKLQTDHIDYYLMHTLTGLYGIVLMHWEPGFPCRQSDGKIVNAGFSSRASGGRSHRGFLRLGILPDPVQLPGRGEPGRNHGNEVRSLEGTGSIRHGAPTRRKPGPLPELLRPWRPYGKKPRSREPQEWPFAGPGSSRVSYCSCRA